MNSYVLIITLAMTSSYGGVAVQWVPFASRAACDQAARYWDGRRIEPNQRTGVQAYCHDTGVKDK